MLRRTVVAVGTTAMLALSLAGCAGGNDNTPAEQEAPAVQAEAPETTPEESTPEPEPAPAQSQVLQSEPPMFVFNNTAYNFDGTVADVLNAIPNIEGDIQDYKYLKPMAENLVIVEYQTAEYDEEWKDYGEPTTHYAIVGEKTVSLDPILEKYNADSIQQMYSFRNGMTLIAVNSESGRVNIAINSDGKELTPPLDPDSLDGIVSGVFAVAYTHYVAYAEIGEIDYEFYDETGNLAYKGTNSGLVGENLVVRENPDGYDYESTVYDTAGNPVVDLKSVANESAAKVCVVPLGAINGVVEIDQYKEAEDEYPSLYGLYSIPLEKWLIEPTTEQVSVVPYGSDIVYAYANGGTHQFFNTLTGEVVYVDSEDLHWYDMGNRWFVGIDYGGGHGSSYVGLYHFDGDNPGLYDDGDFPLIDNDDFDDYDLPEDYSYVIW